MNRANLKLARDMPLARHRNPEIVQRGVFESDILASFSSPFQSLTRKGGICLICGCLFLKAPPIDDSQWTIDPPAMTVLEYDERRPVTICKWSATQFHKSFNSFVLPGLHRLKPAKSSPIHSLFSNTSNMFTTKTTSLR